jgi:trigger factor
MDKELTEDRKFTVNVSSPGGCKRVLEFHVSEEELERERRAVIRELRRDLRVPGFRKGKVPESYITKNYAGAIESDAVRNLLPVVYEQAIMKEGLHPLGEPNFENLKAEEGEGLRMEAHIEVRPEVTLEGYKDIKVEAARQEVTDERVNATLDQMREHMATYQDVSRASTATDYLVIDYAPYGDDGAPDESARQSEYPVDLGSEHLLEEFRTGLVGKNKGDETDITVSYPADFSDEELAGNTKKFQVKVVEVKEKLLPELNDQFAARLDEKFATMLELKVQIRKDLESEEDRKYQHEVQEKIIDQIIAKNQFDVPEVMVNNYLASLVEEDKKRRPEVEDEEKRVEEISEAYRQAAERTIRKYFIIDAVRNQEGLELTPTDIEARIQELADTSQHSEEEIRTALANPETMRSFQGELLDRKVMDLLRSSADIKAA